MEIDAIKLNTLQATQDQIVTPPDTADVDAFTRAMFGNMLITPDEMATAQLQTKSLAVKQAIDGAKPTAEIISSPAEMMTVKSAMSKALLEVELTAKVAGSLGQGINKLVSMQ